MSGFVRVKAPSGVEYSISEDYAVGEGLNIIKDKPAVDANGRPLPAKNPTDLAGEPATKTAAAASKEK